MGSLDEALVALYAQGDRLLEQGPGRVVVAKIHEIDQVRLLRRARETITPHERRAINEALMEIKGHLQDIEGKVAAPRSRTRFDRFREVFSGGVPLDTYLPRTSGTPPALLDAAEAWLIGSLASDRIDDHVEPLLAPWSSATIEPY